MRYLNRRHVTGRRADGVTPSRAAVLAALRQSPANLARRSALMLALALLFLGLLQSRLATLDPAQVMLSLSHVGAGQWLLAAAATLVSFWAVGQYDVTLHRHLRTGLATKPAARAGIAAIAVSQTLGLGLVTGALLRWRLLPGADLWLATRLTLAVTVSFFAGWAMVTAAAVLILPGTAFAPLAMAVLGLGGLLILLSLTLPMMGIRLQRHTLRLPNAITIARILVFTALDLVAAALALYALLPPELPLGFAALLPAYLLALGAGLVSGTPGGVGAFEVALLALLPLADPAPLLAAVLAFRVVYFAAPAVLGGLAALAGPGGRPASSPIWPADPELAISATRAEALLIRQGELSLLPTPDATFVVGRTAHAMIALLDPFPAPATPAGLLALRRAAKAEGRFAALYKCSPRTAACARRAGFHILPIAREAWIDPRAFSLAAPGRAALRRKLRKAEKAGVSITQTNALPQTEMAALSARWAAERGGERGFSMGRHCPRYLAGQRVYLAHVGGRLVSFASFHNGLHEWTLDLMRQDSDTPDGTMQALILAALTDAAALGLRRLSLAAVPEDAFTPRAYPLLSRLAQVEGTGLHQFKQSFAPHWQPLYIAAPSRVALVVAGAEIAREILRPPSLNETKVPSRFTS